MKTITKFICVAFALFAFAVAISPLAQALNPPPDGGYPGANTAEGTQSLFNLTSGIWNTALGYQALNHDTVGANNTATGLRALFNDTSGSYNIATGVYGLYANVDGWFNNAVGSYALANNVSGDGNTAVGYAALWRNTADYNTATGFAALYNNTTGFENTASGFNALSNNTVGNQNTAYGFQALGSNTIDSFNTAIGVQALFSNTGFGGHNNMATGYQALYSNTTGRRNTANGNLALYSNINSNFNTAVGDQALLSLTTALPNEGSNTAIGWGALANSTTGEGNTAIGSSALVNSVTGHQNIVMGYAAGQDLTDGSGNIYISNPGVPAENTTIRIGNVVAWTDIYGFPHAAHNATYIAGISGQTASGGVAVYINSDGKLGTLTSSARFKTEIKPMDKASGAILALKPVTFHYKKEIDPKGTAQFGLVAEDVEKVNPDLVARDAEGKPYTVRYEAVNAMLLNEFLKEHHELQDLKAIVAEQQKQIKALTSGLQKVSAQVELSKSAPQTIADNQ